jgi:dTDP-4-dehydrorhamnose reductase
MWLVTGGTGQLGMAITNLLRSLDIDFVSTDSCILNLKNVQSVSEFVDRYNPKIIINAAAFTNVDGAEINKAEAWAINAEGAGMLAKAAKLSGAVFAQISTDYVFSGFSENPYAENDPVGPLNTYGETKAEGEIKVRSIYPEKSYIFRTAWLYSSERKNFAKSIARKALAFEEIQVVNDQIGQPTFAGDVAKRIIESLLNDLPIGCYHATNSGSASWFEYAREIYRLVGANQELVKPISSGEYPQQALRPKYSVLSHQNWVANNVLPMRAWELALKEALPSIISSVEKENK